MYFGFSSLSILDLLRWNLKNLSSGLNLSRGLNMVDLPLKIVLNVSRFKPALNLNQVLEDLNRDSNSLNSISEVLIKEFLTLASKSDIIILIFCIPI